MGGSQHNPFSLWVLRGEMKELVMSVILRACLCAMFSFMFPLVILDDTRSTEATLQLGLRHPSAKSIVLAAIILPTCVTRYVWIMS